MVATQLISAGELAAMDSDVRVELVEGALIEMSSTAPKHIVYASRLARTLGTYAKDA